MNSRTIVIPRVPISLNKQERMHWSDWHREKQEWIHDIFYLLRESGNVVPQNLPHIWLDITVYFAIIRIRDEANFEPIIIKPLLDALVYAKIIANDTAEFVTRPGEINIKMDRRKPRTEVIIKWK